jgi:NAD(P)-dependent dehydrogenase (short-subunit alcohol dehydrogenase family)
MDDRPRFIGKAALVTGGGRGLGAAIATALAAEGARVGVFARSGEQVEAVAQAIQTAGGTGLAVAGDVRKEVDIHRCIRLLVDHFGPIDILVNCAGVFRMSPSIDADLNELRELLETNLIGTFAMCQAVGQSMLARGSGKIVNFASLLSFIAFPERASYAASKGGVLQLTRVLGVEWASRGVNVNAIAPGMVRIETPHPAIESGVLTEEQITRRIPAARRGKPTDIVGPTLFLLSSDADYIFGQTLVVDGGWLSYGYL